MATIKDVHILSKVHELSAKKGFLSCVSRKPCEMPLDREVMTEKDIVDPTIAAGLLELPKLGTLELSIAKDAIYQIFSLQNMYFKNLVDEYNCNCRDLTPKSLEFVWRIFLYSIALNCSSDNSDSDKRM